MKIQSLKGFLFHIVQDNVLSGNSDSVSLHWATYLPSGIHIFVLNAYNITILFSFFLVLEILYTQALENVIRESEVSEM